MHAYIGEIAALLTAFCWMITSIAFEHAGKQIGALSLNLLRLLMAMVFLCIYTFFTRGYILPFDASPSTWFWLLLSGFIGIVIGDLLLFEAFIRIGARISMLIYASVPPLSGLFAFIILHESMTSLQIIAMIITLIGINVVILVPNSQGKKLQFAHPVLGILLAFGGALGQSLGYIVGKIGVKDYDAFSATQIRLIAGIIGFVLIFTFSHHWKKFFTCFKVKKALKSAALGSFFGPFLGISLSLFAIQRINPGVASTLISITPILLIPYSIIKKEKVYIREIIGSIITILGVGLMMV